jgi:signal transduction histidine kinase
LTRLRLRFLGLALLVVLPVVGLLGLTGELAVPVRFVLAAAWIVGTVFIVRSAVRAFRVEHEARERLEQLDQMRTDFVSMVSHELRNPMATIRGFGQMLRDQPELLQDARRQEAYDVIVRQVDRMASLVDNVLDVSRIESDTLTYAFVPYDVRGLLSEAVDEARAVWPGVPITLDAAHAPEHATGDRDRLKQAIGNVLANACGSSPESGEVLVRATVVGSALSIDVVDHGRGIDEADQGRLFDRFSRLRTTGPGGIHGIGLGLYISRRIVEAHGGSITVDSRIGRGSAFTITVPIEATGPAPGKQPA